MSRGKSRRALRRRFRGMELKFIETMLEPLQELENCPLRKLGYVRDMSISSQTSLSDADL